MKRILVASRDEAVVELLFSIAEEGGYGCEIVAQGGDLWKKAGQAGVVVLDLDFQEEGFRFLESLRRSRPGLPVVVLSSDSSLEMGRRVLEHRVFYYLLKPVSRSEMTQVVTSAMDGKEEVKRRFRTRVRDIRWFRENIPCMDACPVHTDAGQYVQLIAEGKFEEAYLVARSPNPFASICGKVCAAFCEDACRRRHIDEAVTIRALKRFVTTKYGPDSERPDTFRKLLKQKDSGSQWPWSLPVLSQRKVGNGRKVAVIGAGPAGLACAHDLAIMGFKVTVFEASDVVGGAMRLCIPEYRLPRDTLDKEIDAILSLGIDLKLNTPLTPEFGLKELREEGYEAFFLATGALRGTELSIPGADLDGVFKAIDYLLNVNRGYKVELGEKVIVIGGGRVALDAARTAWRQITEIPLMESPDYEALEAARAALRAGKKPTIVYRRSMAEMPAAQTIQGREEIEELLKEGIQILDLRVPKRIIGKDGRVSAVVFDRVAKATDESGRFKPQVIPGAEEVMEADSVILAIGQRPNLSYLREEDGIEISPDGFIAVDPRTLATNVPGVFAGGDAAFGPRTIIEAVWNGKLAAQSIASYLTGKEAERKLRVTIEELPVREYRRAAGYERVPRVPPPTISVERRIGMTEVELDFPEDQAREQAERCLRCHVETIYDASKCVLCGMCVEVCPYECLKLVPLEELELLEEEVGDIVRKLGYEEGVPASAMIKDDERCIRCGLCALRCPTGAMTMERFHFEEV